MSIIFRIAAATELGMIGAENCIHSLSFLPLGGGHLQQIAISFIIAFVIDELGAALSPVIAKLKKLRKASKLKATDS